MPRIACPQCHVAYDDGNRFCPNCGSKTPERKAEENQAQLDAVYRIVGSNLYLAMAIFTTISAILGLFGGILALISNIFLIMGVWGVRSIGKNRSQDVGGVKKLKTALTLSLISNILSFVFGIVGIILSFNVANLISSLLQLTVEILYFASLSKLLKTGIAVLQGRKIRLFGGTFALVCLGLKVVGLLVPSILSLVGVSATAAALGQGGIFPPEAIAAITTLATVFAVISLVGAVVGSIVPIMSILLIIRFRKAARLEPSTGHVSSNGNSAKTSVYSSPNHGNYGAMNKDEAKEREAVAALYSSAGSKSFGATPSQDASVAQKGAMEKETKGQGEEVEVIVSKLFPSEFDKFDERYELEFDNNFIVKDDIPYSFERYQILKDGVTKKNILRIGGRGSASPGVAYLIADIFFKDIDGKPAGKKEGITLTTKEDGERSLSHLGISMPAKAKGGYLRLKKVYFDDGLCWDDHAVELRFSTKEKLEHDLERFIRIHGVK